MARTALIFGVSGQDGSYLARHLLDRGYTVHGTSRDCEIASFRNLTILGIRDRVNVHSATLHDFRSIVQVIRAVKPNEIYNLSAQSAVGLSFEQPVETIDSILNGTLNILEAIRFLGVDARFYHASSSESFGNTLDEPAGETTAFRPCSPYGVAKSAAHWMVANYRQAYGLYACSGILFNHESPLRPARFVTRKIVRGAIAVAQGRAKTLELGNLAVARDWGWAPEYVDAMWRMLQQDEPDDFVIATGRMHALEDFVRTAFAHFGMDWREHVVQGATNLRPMDIHRSVGNPAKAAARLGWKAETLMPDLVSRLIEAELALPPP
ncbi:GDP-mannose 4,6-dehydratase (plasmid) [Azospirillum sp. TSH58]|uniref:GDP-mannose 4,6-dehydratase n=1 Tax=Azospirillum sp. TSH58 TaxID=664962 RepID=UPI000D5FEA17|nr:GDP-mannose 4,6-dehydratase [Azospirillum sp. TSH58]AWJ85542.1 GDP-mannose 4,6-dehydratase [Azospirillum sp. TSH58]PWC81050.1 NAD-dependent dehydratase [Azospirillum sp. TSH58]